MSGWGKGIKQDLLNRRPWYVSDWKEGFSSGYRCCHLFVLSILFLPAWRLALNCAAKRCQAHLVCKSSLWRPTGEYAILWLLFGLPRGGQHVLLK